MKVVILAGGLGTRLSEETTIKPKPMVEIGGMPILWHIMKIYAHFGYNEFVIALGYKSEIIKDYFLNYFTRKSNLTINLEKNEVSYGTTYSENWKIHLIDTGKDTLTGGRLARLSPILKNDGTFMLTYGDGVANVNISELVAFHKMNKGLATVTAVRPPARFGAMVFNGDKISDFKEKPQVGEGWINGGFFVMEPEVFEYLNGDTTILEKEPLENLANDKKLFGYKHDAFWHPMDTIRDRDFLNEEWRLNKAKWKVWEN